MKKESPRQNGLVAPSKSKSYVRFGGELPSGCDPQLSAPAPEPSNVLFFSHGRAAIGWFIQSRGPFAAAAVSAYTCPSVPAYIKSHGLPVVFFDHESDIEAVLTILRPLPKPYLVLVPALFGFDPWLDAAALARKIDEAGSVIIDAAQTAFGHLDYVPPPGGAVLSCPRKTTALDDGAVLALPAVSGMDRESLAVLPVASAAIEARRRGRELLTARDISREQGALAALRQGESLLPPIVPCRMSDESRRRLALLDASAHAAIRRRNFDQLMAQFDGRMLIPINGKGTPFGFPILVESREAVLARLRALRVFATPLWPDARHDPTLHPRAAILARKLISLPVDQRYGEDDMGRMVEMVLSVA